MSTWMRLGWRLTQAGHWLKRRLEPPAVILMYHRVTELANDPHLLAVTPGHFAEHLETIRSHGVPLRLGDLVRALQEGRVPPRAVVVTLDDGYADNLHHAKPLLARHGVPATVFVTAGQVGLGREFWWDELDRVLLQPGTLPSELRLRVNGSVREWRLDGSSTYSEEEYRRDRSWHIECRDDPGPRQRLFRAVFDLLYHESSTQREAILDQLGTWAQAPALARPTHRVLTAEEAARLLEGDLVEIGAHTMTHPVLAARSPADQRWEIQESKTRLQAMLGREVVSFAYPHGSTTPEATASLREAGFLCACSSRADSVFRTADRFELPRLGVRDWDGDRFARWLRWWLGR
jgi:peptidoglycan/xylan/chitin deacetylase (PgdA/CDA1 family)